MTTKRQNAKKPAKPGTKTALREIFAQLAPIGLGILLTELERKFLKPEHVSMIDEHNDRMEEKRLDLSNSASR